VFRLVPGSGHLTPLEQPVVFNGILRDLLAC
jgi:pimeloyl-ACP methyl ester carboxylesterase